MENICSDFEFLSPGFGADLECFSLDGHFVSPGHGAEEDGRAEMLVFANAVDEEGGQVDFGAFGHLPISIPERWIS